MALGAGALISDVLVLKLGGWVSGVMDFILLLYFVTHVYGTEFSICQLLCNKNGKVREKHLDLSHGEYQALQTR